MCHSHHYRLEETRISALNPSILRIYISTTRFFFFFFFFFLSFFVQVQVTIVVLIIMLCVFYTNGYKAVTCQMADMGSSTCSTIFVCAVHTKANQAHWSLHGRTKKKSLIQPLLHSVEQGLVAYTPIGF